MKFAPWAATFTAWLLAASATLSALFMSEIMGLAPCVLCWYQRIFMFPLLSFLAFLTINTLLITAYLKTSK